MAPIQSIHIPSPCHESWQQMTPVEQGRHCAQCCKTVTDFSVMSNTDIIAYLATANNVCGRFNREQLSNLNNNLYVQNLRPSLWRRWVMVIGLLGQGMFYKAIAQTKPVQIVTQYPKPATNNMILGKVAVPDSNQKVVIRGQITDENHKPLPGVTVTIKGSSTGTMTTTNGKFVLNGARAGEVLHVSFIGFNTQDVTLNSSAEQTYTIMMKEDAHMLAGEVMISRRPSFFKRTWYKIKRIF